MCESKRARNGEPSSRKDERRTNIMRRKSPEAKRRRRLRPYFRQNENGRISNGALIYEEANGDELMFLRIYAKARALERVP